VKRWCGAAALIFAVACGESFLRTNPYDPAFAVQISVTGPDSLLSLGDLGQYVAHVTPAFPDSSIVWAADTVSFVSGDTLHVVDGSFYLIAGQNGQFQSINPPLEPETRTIAVEALIGRIDTTVARCNGTVCFPVKTVQYRHTGLKSVVITQRVTRIRLRCPDPETHACAPISAGATWSVWVDGFDALGRQIVALTGAATNPTKGPPVATFVSRDTTIASVSPVGIRAATVTARKSGSTWIVGTRGSLRDSLQLVVQ
jgi:hypothetical protein